MRAGFSKHNFNLLLQVFKHKVLIIFYALQVIYLFSTIISAGRERQYPAPADKFVSYLKVGERAACVRDILA